MNRSILNHAVFVGSQGRVVAICKNSGSQLWKTRLKTDVTATNIIVDDHKLYAHSGGYLYCLDASNGRVLWENSLSECGFGDCNIAVQATSNSRTQAIAI